MFRKELADKLKQIFCFPKVTFDVPSDSYEQDVLFVEVTEMISNLGNGRANAKVTGFLTCFSQIEKLPFGFFMKRVQLAEWKLTKDLFFTAETDVLSSKARIQNISERRIGFQYLYSGQFDPEQGDLTSLTFGEES